MFFFQAEMFFSGIGSQNHIKIISHIFRRTGVMVYMGFLLLFSIFVDFFYISARLISRQNIELSNLILIWYNINNKITFTDIIQSYPQTQYSIYFSDSFFRSFRDSERPELHWVNILEHESMELTSMCSACCCT